MKSGNKYCFTLKATNEILFWVLIAVPKFLTISKPMLHRIFMLSAYLQVI